eukprot:62211_1
MGICFGCAPTLVEASVMMIGLDGAGKTTILKYLKDETTYKTLPTLGFNVDKVQFEGLDMTIWDIGGQHKLRSLWQHYFGSVQALIFVIDANDRERIFGKGSKDKANKDDDSVKYWLEALTTMPQLHDCIFLILANKQDQQDALTTNQVIGALDLCGTLRGKTWHCCPTVALTGEGVDSAFCWLNLTLQKHQMIT